MTRKTKEEKKIAAYRKKLQLLQEITRAKNIDQPKKVSEPPNEKTIETIESEPTPIHFIKDLKKSLLVILLISALEIIIYFARINR